MISNRVRRNIWLVMIVMSIVVTVDRVVRFVDGALEWWQLLAPVVITALSTKFYLCYRREVRHGNLYGKVDPRRYKL